MEPLPAGARVPPPPPRPPAPPTTGWADRPGEPARPAGLRKVTWPSPAALGRNTALLLAVLVVTAALLVIAEFVTQTVLRG